jgi:hypothetical protein
MTLTSVGGQRYTVGCGPSNSGGAAAAANPQQQQWQQQQQQQSSQAGLGDDGAAARFSIGGASILQVDVLSKNALMSDKTKENREREAQALTCTICSTDHTPSRTPAAGREVS